MRAASRCPEATGRDHPAQQSPFVPARLSGVSAGASSAGPSPEDVVRAVDKLVDECLETCLWYQRPDYRPGTNVERWLVLDAIQKHADVSTFQRAARLKQWLSLLSSNASAGS